MSKDLATFAATTRQTPPPQVRLPQPAPTAEILIALAVLAAIGMLIGAGFVLERKQRRSKAANRVKARPAGRPVGSTRAAPRRGNLRLVTPKRR